MGASLRPIPIRWRRCLLDWLVFDGANHSRSKAWRRLARGPTAGLAISFILVILRLEKSEEVTHSRHSLEIEDLQSWGAMERAVKKDAPPIIDLKRVSSLTRRLAFWLQLEL